MALQLSSLSGSERGRPPRCLNQVVQKEMDFVVEIFDTVSPNCHGALWGAHELGPLASAIHINNFCTGINGPEPSITPVVLTRMCFDFPKVLGFFVQFQPLYLWEVGHIIQVCLVK